MIETSEMRLIFFFIKSQMPFTKHFSFITTFFQRFIRSTFTGRNFSDKFLWPTISETKIIMIKKFLIDRFLLVKVSHRVGHHVAEVVWKHLSVNQYEFDIALIRDSPSEFYSIKFGLSSLVWWSLSVISWDLVGVHPGWT